MITLSTTEKTARSYIEELMKSGFRRDAVSSITCEEEGVYVFTFNEVEREIYEQSFAKAGAEYFDATQTVTVTIQEGKIVKVESHVDASGYLKKGNYTYQIGLTVDSVCTF